MEITILSLDAKIYSIFIPMIINKVETIADIKKNTYVNVAIVYAVVRLK